jgi:eukaryotic-like serine/threonine-protein kinase
MALSIPQMARMSQLLDEALTLDEAARRAWLESLPPEHRDLAPALREALLPGERQAAALNDLTSLPKLGAGEGGDFASTSGLQPGARVGPYELIRLLGAGGMAEVWLARRADGAFKREIALKLPMLAHARAGLEARFARERDILASLEHPHIARLYDAGMDPRGLPYIAMEYVQGEPLTDWCDTHRLGIPERLALFLQVLEAVQYAHEKHVIHRDLKPSNILVTESGQVRLLDFGVARLFEAEKTDQTALTSIYGRALTPDYASPELLRGDPIDARSDLYSLGVLLYELLTGTRPYRLKSAASIGALDQAIATLEVKKPSTQLEQAAVTSRNSTAERLARQLRGDLDAIVLKALARDPAQRYPSAEALAEDLRRHLEGKPIRAQPVRISYRLGKFVRRNRALFGVSVAALAAILAAVIYTRYRESHVQVAVTAATAKYVPSGKSIAVLPFTDMSEKKDQEYFSDGLSEELIDMLTKVNGLRVPARTSSFYFKGKSEDIAAIAQKLHVSHILEGSVRKSGHKIRVTAQLIQAETGYDVWSQTYDRDLKDIFEVQDQIAGAVVQALKSTLLASSAPSDRTTNVDAYSLLLQGRFLSARQTEADTRQAIRVLQRAVSLDPNYDAAWVDLSRAYFLLFAYVDQGDEPEQDLERAHAAAQTAVMLEPSSAEAHLMLAQVKALYEDNWKGAIAEIEAARRADPGVSIPMELVFVSGCHLAPCFDQLIAEMSAAIDRDPLNASAYRTRGYVRYAVGQLEGAESDIRRGLELSPNLLLGHFWLTLILIARHDLTDILTVAGTEESGYGRVARAMAYQALGRKAEADAALKDLVTHDARDDCLEIAMVYAQRGENAAALDWLERDYRLHLSGRMYFRVAPSLKPLEHEPRYVALVRQLSAAE